MCKHGNTAYKAKTIFTVLMSLKVNIGFECLYSATQLQLSQANFL